MDVRVGQGFLCFEEIDPRFDNSVEELEKLGLGHTHKCKSSIVQEMKIKAVALIPHKRGMESHKCSQEHESEL
jgi:hypothetical protein